MRLSQLKRDIICSIDLKQGGDDCGMETFRELLRKKFPIVEKYLWLLFRHLHNNQIQSMGAQCFEGLHSLETLWVFHTHMQYMCIFTGTRLDFEQWLLIQNT